MEPFSLDDPGFLHLLASQSSQPILPSQSSQTIPPSPSSQTIDLDCSDDTASKGKRKWTPKEDGVLISAWLNTSKDPIVGNEQKAGTFWKRIVDYYNASPLLAGVAPRELPQCKQRWGRLSETVSKFAGSYELAVKQQKSGQNEDDVMKAAYEIFLNDHKVKFSLEHAWRELRNDQKWCSTISTKDGGNDKRKSVVEDEGSVEMSETRPPGIKAAKAAKRNKSGPDEKISQVQTMLRHKILERLLSKTEPLTENEEALKNKLVAEML